MIGASQFAQKGAAAVEFALVALLFFMFMFGILEVARIMYMYNTLADVTRSAARAAANIDSRDGNALTLAFKRAVLDESSGKLPFGDPITYQNIRIDYLYIDAASGTLKLLPVPAGPLGCPARIRQNCLANPYGSNCVRAVQARICKDGGASTCEQVDYEMLFPLVKLGLPLPISTTIVSAESLGYSPGESLCP